MKTIFLKNLIIIIYLISSSVSYSIERPEIKNLIIHKDKKKIENIEFTKSEAQKVSLNNFKQNPLIINFWATWCAPCKKEMPSLSLLKKNQPKIKIFAINLEKPNKNKAQKFFDDLKIENLKIYFDPNFDLAKNFKMRGLPTSILIDKNGNEFGRIIGEINFNEKEFSKFLEEKINS